MSHDSRPTSRASAVSGRLLALLGASLLLVACGGGSQSNNGATAAGSLPLNGSVAGTTVSAAGSSVQTMGLGINMLSYWGGAHATADLVRESQFRSMSWGTPAFDTNGWPTQDFMLLHPQGPVGTYKIVFNGQATISGSVNGQTYDPLTNTTTANYVVNSFPNPNTGWTFDSFTNTKLTATSAINTGISNLRFYRPGYATDGSQIFTSEFINAIKRFGWIRGMDMVNANGNPSQTWSDRSLMAFAGEPENKQPSPWSLAYSGPNTTYNSSNVQGWYPGGFSGSRGHPWEFLILLANTANTDLWLNIPARVDDDYITKLAQLVKYGSDGVNPYTSPQANPVYPPLNAGLNVYLEYGNEIWNTAGGFNCYYWVKDLADSVGGNTAHPIAFDGVQDQYTALFRYIAYRSSNVSLLFRQVFGDNAMMTRVRPILSSQAGNANDIYFKQLRWADDYYGQVRAGNPVVRKVKDIWYGGGGAAYFSSNFLPTDSLPASMAAYFAGMPSDAFVSRALLDSTLSSAYGIRRVAYEGGPGIDGVSVDDMRKYNADPRMQERMLVAQDMWNAVGDGQLTYYVYQGTLSWDFSTGLSGVADTSTTKLQAIDIIKNRPKAALTIGTAMPGSTVITSAADVVKSSGFIWFGDGTYYRVNPTGEFIIVPIRVAAAGVYNIQISTFNSTGSSVALYANGELAGQWTPSFDNSNANKTSAAIPVTLPEGLTALRIRGADGSTWIHDLTVSLVVPVT